MRTGIRSANRGPQSASRFARRRSLAKVIGAVLGAGAVLMHSPELNAGPITHFALQVPCSGICPQPALLGEVQAGQTFTLEVLALDSQGLQDATYRGTVRFSSSDPAATLPNSYTFAPIDQGGHAFRSQVILRTAGWQTITAVDEQDAAITGTVRLLVTDQAVGIPLLNQGTMAFLALALAIAGVWLLKAAN